MPMTSEEIKATYSMRDILTKCGLPEPNRAGFCHCPFHKGDRDPSMKVYDKDGTTVKYKRKELSIYDHW